MSEVGATIAKRKRRREEPVVVHYVDEHGKSQVCEPSQAGAVHFETSRLARRIPSYKAQRHTPGFYYFSTTNRTVPYESYREKLWLTVLDFDRTTADISSQPMRIVGLVDDQWLDHVPDFFVRRTDGRGVVVDVKHPGYVDKPKVAVQRQLTQQVCEQLGFEYEFLSAIGRQRWANIRFLAGFKRPVIDIDDVKAEILEVANGSPSISQLCSIGSHPMLTRPLVLHLCWRGSLEFDLDEPLRDRTQLRRGPTP